jgi:LPPG:FO 2-phospho-L-lactate transferase
MNTGRSDARAPCVALSGGVGGAKLILGLSHVLPGPSLRVIANTGDDFEHLGLSICPDLDTLMYTLADQVNVETGWGLRNETWSFLDALRTLGGETWFRLGDRDLATHVERTRRLANGESLTAITQALCKRLGVAPVILPMSDDPVRTHVRTDSGTLAFQHYFVRDRAAPRVLGLEYRGAATARPSEAAMRALQDPRLNAVIIAPSNPYLSIDPILATGVGIAMRQARAPVLAVSPIVGGAALKGPTAKIMAELGLDVSALAVAEHYQDLLDGFILDASDADLAPKVRSLGIEVAVCNTVMNTLDDKLALARAVLDLADSLSRRG